MEDHQDSNIETSDYAIDTKYRYSIGLGGINLKLVECVLTNDAIKVQVNVEVVGGGGWNSYSVRPLVRGTMCCLSRGWQIGVWMVASE
jgi:hypothetical protein